ncbi:polysaccharide deacetylase family protein [Thermodesulfobacteriota bacterium]
MKKVIGIRVDIDFEIGLTKGVPFLLNFFKRMDLQATFFVTMGSDGFRHSRKRLNSKNYLRRVSSFGIMNIISRFGLPYLTKQFIGLSGKVGVSHPEILNEIIQRGHDIGAHGYDHYWWAENVYTAEERLIKRDMENGVQALKSAIGSETESWASPNWRCSKHSLKIIDEYDFMYGADCRGESPFFPQIDGWQAKKIQLPISLSCLHEVKQALGTGNRDKIINCLMAQLKDRYNLLCIHGYYEGILERKMFMEFIEKAKGEGFRFVPMKTLFEGLEKKEVPVCEIIRKELPGGRGQVSCQGRRIIQS